jgi:hypothetical protein
MLWRIDPYAADVAAAISVGPDPEFVAVGGGSVWTASRATGSLERIDARTDQVVESTSLGQRIGALWYADGRVWVAAE